MTWLKSISQLFLIALLVAVIIWLLSDKCNRKQPVFKDGASVIKEQKRIRDSAFSVQKAKDEIHKADSTKWKNKIDSTNSLLAIKQKQLTKAQASAVQLALEVKQAAAKKDTSQLLLKCTELGDRVIELNAQVDDFRIQVDTLTRAKDSLQAVTQKRLEEKEQLLSDFRKSVDASDMHYVELETKYKKAMKKVDKKYTIGIGVTGGITTVGTPGGSVGITISRTIIRL
jgi:chromosome segregation ATPase